MENEYQILNHLQENEITTQRKIALRTGLSLGAVNILIKKMTRKGLVKIEKLNSRTMRYILTPQGMQEKASLTYSYIKHSYHQLLRISQVLDELILNNNNDQPDQKVILCGPPDEIREILIQSLKERSLPYEVHANPQSLAANNNQNLKMIITWRSEEEEALNVFPHAFNIMKLI